MEYESFKWLIKRVRILLALEAECPVLSCRKRAGFRTYKYPQQWLNHLATDHSVIAHESVIDATIGRTSSSQTSGAGQSAHTTAREQSIQSNSSIHQDELSEPTPLPESNILLALDLCLPELATKATHQWRDLDFKPTWMDRKLFQDLAEGYFTLRPDSLLLPHHKLFVQVVTWLSFTRLSRISPTRVRDFALPVSTTRH